MIVEDGRDVGRIYEDRNSKPEPRWFWAISIYVNPVLRDARTAVKLAQTA